MGSTRKAPIPRRLWFAYYLGCTPGFRRSSCKRLLKLTMSRVKLLRRRRESQVKQLRIDVAQLLHRAKTSDAEARLDRLWKEASLLSVYVKVGEYCHLLKANLYNIAWQKECPTDLREALESLYFAASHCSDLPELKDVREIMANKYGKEFSAGSLVSKQFLQAFYETIPSEDCKKVLMKEICAEFHIKYPPQVEIPSKVSKQAISSVIPEENSASVHGQDVSYGSLDTHGVCWQEGKSHHKQIRSIKAISDTHTDMTVQLAGNTRERKGMDVATVDRISRQVISVRLHEPLHEKPYTEEVDSKQINARKAELRETKEKKYDEEEYVNSKIGTEDFNALHKFSPSRLHSKRGKPKLERPKYDVEDGQAWPKHSVRIHDHDKAEMEALHESTRRSRSQKKNRTGQGKIHELYDTEQLDSPWSKKGKNRSMKKHQVGTQFDVSPDRNHGFIDERLATVGTPNKNPSGQVQEAFHETLSLHSKKKHHHSVQSKHEEIRKGNNCEEYEANLEGVTNEQQYMEDELIHSTHQRRKESKRTRKKHSRRDASPHRMFTDGIDGVSKEFEYKCKVPQYEDNHYHVTGKDASRNTLKATYDGKHERDEASHRLNEVNLSMEGGKGKDLGYRRKPPQSENNHDHFLQKGASKNTSKPAYDDLENEHKLSSHDLKLSAARDMLKPTYDDDLQKESMYNRLHEEKMSTENADRHWRGGKIRRIPQDEEHNVGSNQRYDGEHGRESRHGSRQRKLSLETLNGHSHGGKSHLNQKDVTLNLASNRAYDTHLKAENNVNSFEESNAKSFQLLHKAKKVDHSLQGNNGHHTFQPSKPPDRPPPPIPSHRMRSLQNQSMMEPQIPLVLPQGSNILGPNQLRQQHVHPNLPEYEDIFATFVQFKREKSID